MSVQLIRHRFTVDEYHEIARAGVLRDDDRVELIDGEVVDMTPIGLRHGGGEAVSSRARFRISRSPWTSSSDDRVTGSCSRT